MGLQIAPQLFNCVLELVPNTNSKCPPHLSSDMSPGNVAAGDSIVLFRDSNDHVANDSLTWKGRIRRNSHFSVQLFDQQLLVPLTVCPDITPS